jgi:hypothetical protein
VSLAFKNHPIRVTNETDGTSFEMWSDSPTEVRTRAGARIHASLPLIGSVGPLGASAVVPPTGRRAGSP